MARTSKKGPLTVLKGAADALAKSEATVWLPPRPQPQKQKRKQKQRQDTVLSSTKRRSIPQRRNDLELPILLTHFSRWSSKPHSNKGVAPHVSTLPGLYQNVFAQILASPPRMDKFTQAVLPRDLLVQTGVVAGENQEVLVTPLWSDDTEVKGSKAYIGLSRNAEKAASTKKVFQLASFMLQHKPPKNTAWNTNFNVEGMIKIEIEKLKGDIEYSVGQTPQVPFYWLDFETNSAPVSFECDDREAGNHIMTINLAKLVDRQFASVWKDSFGASRISLSALSARNRSFLKLLWRYYIFYGHHT